MDRLIVGRKLDSLRRCLERVRSKCPDDATKLAADADLQDIVVLNLSRAVQLCVDIALHVSSDHAEAPPESMGETFAQLAAEGVICQELAIRLQKAVGFRNIAVHNYSAIDWEIVHAIATLHLVDFEDYARAVAAVES